MFPRLRERIEGAVGNLEGLIVSYHLLGFLFFPFLSGRGVVEFKKADPLGRLRREREMEMMLR